MKIIFLILLSFVLISCNKEEKKERTQRENDNNTEQTEENVTGSDTTMTPEEMFSSALVEDIVGESDDALEIYLEEQFYPVASKSKVSLDRISSSLYLFTYYENGVMKNFLIQKFYDPGKDEFVYEKMETQTNAMRQFLK